MKSEEEEFFSIVFMLHVLYSVIGSVFAVFTVISIIQDDMMIVIISFLCFTLSFIGNLETKKWIDAYESVTFEGPSPPFYPPRCITNASLCDAFSYS